MPESLSTRKTGFARPRRPRLRDIGEISGGLDEAHALVDASYGDTLRRQMPRRLSALTRPRRAAP